MTPPAVFGPMDRATFELVVKTELGRLSVLAPTLATVNRARRVILAAADAYRAWLPDADPPTETQRTLQDEHVRTLRAALYAVEAPRGRKALRHESPVPDRP